MNYNDLADAIDTMTPEEREAGVKVRIGNAKDLCDVKDFRVGEHRVDDPNAAPPNVFLVI